MSMGDNSTQIPETLSNIRIIFIILAFVVWGLIDINLSFLKSLLKPISMYSFFLFQRKKTIGCV